MPSWQRDVRNTLSFLIWFLFTAMIFVLLLVGANEAAVARWAGDIMGDSEQLLLITMIPLAAALVTWFAVASGWYERVMDRAILGPSTMREAPPTIDQQHAAKMTAAEMMSVAYERRSAKALTTLVIALLFCAVLLWIDTAPSSLVTALAIAVLYVLAVLRQAILRMRVARRYFGNTEHEVRQLLWFVLQHSRPQDFSGGRPANALDLQPEESPATLGAAEAT